MNTEKIQIIWTFMGGASLIALWIKYHLDRKLQDKKIQKEYEAGIKKLIWEKKYPKYDLLYCDFIDTYVKFKNCPKYTGNLKEEEQEEIKQCITSTISTLIKIIKNTPLLDNDYFSKLEIDFKGFPGILKNTLSYNRWLMDDDWRKTISGEELRKFLDEIMKYDGKMDEIKKELSYFISKDLSLNQIN